MEDLHSDLHEFRHVQREVVLLDLLTDLLGENSKLRVLEVLESEVARAELPKKLEKGKKLK